MADVPTTKQRHPEGRIKELENTVADLSKKIDQLQKSITTVIEVIQAAKGALAVLEFLGKCAKPVLWIGGLITLLGVLWAKHKPGGL